MPLLLVSGMEFPEVQPLQLQEGSCPSGFVSGDPDAGHVEASCQEAGFFAGSFAEPFAVETLRLVEFSWQFLLQQVEGQVADVVASQAALGSTVAVEGSHLAPCLAFPLTEKVERSLEVFAHMEEGCWHAEDAELMLAAAAVGSWAVAGSSSSHHFQTFAGTDGPSLPTAVAALMEHLQPQVELLEADIAEWAAVG